MLNPELGNSRAHDQQDDSTNDSKPRTGANAPLPAGRSLEAAGSPRDYWENPEVVRRLRSAISGWVPRHQSLQLTALLNTAAQNQIERQDRSGSLSFPNGYVFIKYTEQELGNIQKDYIKSKNCSKRGGGRNGLKLREAYARLWESEGRAIGPGVDAETREAALLAASAVDHVAHHDQMAGKVMRFMFQLNLTRSEIAAELGCSESTVFMRLKRAKQLATEFLGTALD